MSAGGARESGDGLVVVTSCTAQKVVVPADSAARRDSTAESLYAGQQHVRLMRGVRAYRAAHRPVGPLRLHILSAYHGLVPAARRVATYDHTFAGQPRRRRARARPTARRARPHPGAAQAPLWIGPCCCSATTTWRRAPWMQTSRLGGPTIAFCAPNVAQAACRHSTACGSSLLHNREAQRFSCGLIALKGELGGRLLTRLAADPASLNAVDLAATSTCSAGWIEQPTTTG